MTYSAKGLVAIAALSAFVASAPAQARPTGSATTYDGAWHLSFVTQAGACGPSYEFYVNIARGVITHPNLVRFRGYVSPGGATRASVAVQDKVASGTGRLSLANGRGLWSGSSGGGRCSGQWTARKI